MDDHILSKILTHHAVGLNKELSHIAIKNHRIQTNTISVKLAIIVTNYLILCFESVDVNERLNIGFTLNFDECEVTINVNRSFSCYASVEIISKYKSVSPYTQHTVYNNGKTNFTIAVVTEDMECIRSDMHWAIQNELLTLSKASRLYDKQTFKLAISLLFVKGNIDAVIQDFHANGFLASVADKTESKLFANYKLNISPNVYKEFAVL